MKVLVINPGATSTKIAVFDEDKQVFKKGIDHSAQELDRFDRVIDQADYRQKAILDAVAESGYQLSDFDAVLPAFTSIGITSPFFSNKNSNSLVSFGL